MIRLRTIFLDYDIGDDVSGALMAYKLNGARLAKAGILRHDDRDYVYRLARMP